MSNFDSALINGALQQGEPRLQKRYIVKNPNPLPKGRFSIRIIEREHDIGAAVDLLDTSDRFIIPTKADIVFRSDGDDCDGPGIKIGYIGACVILSSLMGSSGLSDEFQIICDEHSHDLAKMADELFDDRGEHKNSDWREADYGDILYIQEVYLEPKWRGYGIGLLAVRGLIDVLPSFEMDSVIIDPAPLTRSNTEHGCYPTACSLDQTISALKKYWGLLGFRKASKKNDVNYLEVWTGYVRPSIREIVPHLF
ncbi:hypothetical protein VKT23_009895 [Stygiomarasmius scandens]|uniref:N-acetyltransferase domain-containing protein n=1 Tax=Marasmiellus scandens TaxID=2682957 RepID=A0ABR1JG21_9AGAR